MRGLFEQSQNTVIYNGNATKMMSNMWTIKCSDLEINVKPELTQVDKWIVVFRGSIVVVHDIKTGNVLSQFKLSITRPRYMRTSYSKSFKRLYFFGTCDGYRLVVYSLSQVDLLAMHGQSFDPVSCVYARRVDLQACSVHRLNN